MRSARQGLATENRTTVADANTKGEISPQLYGSHRDFGINPFSILTKKIMCISFGGLVLLIL